MLHNSSARTCKSSHTFSERTVIYICFQINSVLKIFIKDIMSISVSGHVYKQVFSTFSAWCVSLNQWEFRWGKLHSLDSPYQSCNLSNSLLSSVWLSMVAQPPYLTITHPACSDQHTHPNLPFDMTFVNAQWRIVSIWLSVVAQPPTSLYLTTLMKKITPNNWQSYSAFQI